MVILVEVRWSGCCWGRMARESQLGATLAESSCLGVADLLWSGNPDSSCVLAEVGQGEAKELALLDLPHGHGWDILGQLSCT